MWLESIKEKYIHGGDEAYDCCRKQAIDKAIKAIKHFEKVNPIRVEDDNFECGNCGALVGWDELDTSGIVPIQYDFCPVCGRPVRWGKNESKWREI